MKNSMARARLNGMRTHLRRSCAPWTYYFGQFDRCGIAATWLRLLIQFLQKLLRCKFGNDLLG
jgi:hypothetical protein